MYLCTKWHVSKCSESSLFAIKPKAEENVRRSAMLLFYLNIHFPTDTIEDPAQVGIDCTCGQTNSDVSRKSKRQHTGNWSAAAWPPRSVIAQQYSPATTASFCSHTPKRKVGAFQNLISLFTVFEIALAGDFILSKGILTNFYILGRSGTLRHFIILSK